MKEWLFLINSGAVGLYGAILSAAFCDVTWNKRNKVIFGSTLILLGVLQAFLYTAFGGPALRFWYPIITHLPLALLIWYLSKRCLWSFMSVFVAYLCCQLRRWIGLLCVEIFAGDSVMQTGAELVVTIPLLLLLIRFAAPAVRELTHYPQTMQVQFGVLPVISYVFDYSTRVYTNWLVAGVPAAVEFMPFVCTVAYLAFALHGTQTVKRQSELEQIQSVLDLQVKQSVRQIDGMKKSQELAAAYRHDLRHHLQYLSACLENGAVKQAQAYICSLNEEITKQVVKQYCENTSVNLILSSYAGRAETKGITMSVNIHLGEELSISDSDLCVLLSNALENALNSCMAAKLVGNDASLEVRGYAKESKVFIEISNSYVGTITFENGHPVTHEKGHGTGVRSICAIVEKYKGMYLFEASNGRFLIRLSI